MGNSISKQTVVITVGPQQSKFHVSYQLLIDNFGFFGKTKRFTNEKRSYFFPTISESTLENFRVKTSEVKNLKLST